MIKKHLIFVSLFSLLILTANISLAAQKESISSADLSSVHFYYNKVFVPAEYKPVLAQHAKFMQQRPELKVLLVGNSDMGGRQQVHQRVGKLRAEEVKKHLINLGVAASRISITTEGSSQPLAKGHSTEEWRKNRRVEFVYLTK